LSGKYDLPDAQSSDSIDEYLKQVKLG
jgi:hypothetical protein